jgi:hypothetical protein
VICRDAVVARADALHFHDIDEKGDELVGPLRQMLRALEHRGFIGEELGIVDADHAAAGTRGDDDIIERLEGGDHLARDRLGIGLVARIIGGLTATGLRERHLDAAARLFQELHRGKAHGGPVEIDEAGDEKPHAGRCVGHRAAVLNGALEQIPKLPDHPLPSSLRKQGPRASDERCNPGFPFSRERRQKRSLLFYRARQRMVSRAGKSNRQSKAPADAGGRRAAKRC